MTPRERQSAAILKREGAYRLSARVAGSFGASYLYATGPRDSIVCQVIAGRPPSPAERAELKAFPCSSDARRVVHVWRDRARLPVVTEL